METATVKDALTIMMERKSVRSYTGSPVNKEGIENIHWENGNPESNTMYITIDDNVKLKDLQEAFSNFYPYLQIGFYKKPHKKYEVSDESYLLNPNKTISEIKRTHVTGLLEIKSLDRV